MPAQSKPFRRYALEAITIVASILFALWVDATWDDYQERQREARYLDGLVVEFDAAAAELANDQRVRKIILGNLEAALAPAQGESPDEARRFASDPSNILTARFYTPTHANLEDLVASGNLQILRSDALRKALLAYDQDSERLRVVEQDYREFINDNVEPYVLEHADFGGRPLGIDPGNPSPLDPALWEDPHFVNLVWMEHARLEDITLFAERLAQRIEVVRQALDEARGADVN